MLDEQPAPDEQPTGVLAEPNEGRSLLAALEGTVYARHPVRTHLVTAQDDVVAAADLPATATGVELPYALPPDTPAAVAVRASSRLGWSG